MGVFDRRRRHLGRHRAGGGGAAPNLAGQVLVRAILSNNAVNISPALILGT
ncbi:MAG: hypothetical protein MZV70_52285 [Desulfobacterales bacterium]|nr:hypothetical protein [Desulfobacterales bacterium]